MAELYSISKVKMLKSTVDIQKPTQKNIRNTAIIGLNRSGYLAYRRIRKNLKDRENLTGIIDVHDRRPPDSNQWESMTYLGILNDFSQLVSKHQINHAVIAIHPDDISQVHQIINLCKFEKIEYEFASEVHDVIYGNTIHQIFKDLQRPWSPNLRQVVDSCLALLCMFFLLPLFMVISVLIKLDSTGPVLFSQERIGIRGRIFRIFKFRTMYIDAEKFTGPVLASKDDPRITRVGRFLRKTRIDEIPQLINVVIGDMAIIGPRPERPYFVEKYTHEIPMYKNRLKLKPGITGLAQVVVGYDESLEDVRNKLSHDLQYVEKNNSIWMNFYILLKTVKVVLSGKGQ